jgi:hypothetical protein
MGASRGTFSRVPSTGRRMGVNPRNDRLHSRQTRSDAPCRWTLQNRADKIVRILLAISAAAGAFSGATVIATRSHAQFSSGSVGQRNREFESTPLRRPVTANRYKTVRRRIASCEYRMFRGFFAIDRVRNSDVAPQRPDIRARATDSLSGRATPNAWTKAKPSDACQGRERDQREGG